MRLQIPSQAVALLPLAFIDIALVVICGDLFRAGELAGMKWTLRAGLALRSRLYKVLSKYAGVTG